MAARARRIARKARAGAIHPDERLAPGTIVLTAWTRLLKLGSYDASLIRSFIDANMDRCCESVA